MSWTKGGLKLIKTFSSGVSCPKWNENTIEKTMFHPQCEEIARKTGKQEIDEDVVREYILMVHNPVTVRIGIIGKESIEAIENCMVRPEKKGDEWVCVHGTAVVMIISKDEAEFLEMSNKKLLKSLR